jgi:hypothetical protein
MRGGRVGYYERGNQGTQIATNVTSEQMESLPQPDRTSLNFAGLAPGITVSRGEYSQQILAGGLPANKINVFVHGGAQGPAE